MNLNERRLIYEILSNRIVTMFIMLLCSAILTGFAAYRCKANSLPSIALTDEQASSILRGNPECLNKEFVCGCTESSTRGDSCEDAIDCETAYIIKCFTPITARYTCSGDKVPETCDSHTRSIPACKCSFVTMQK